MPAPPNPALHLKNVMTYLMSNTVAMLKSRVIIFGKYSLIEMYGVQKAAEMPNYLRVSRYFHRRQR